MLFFELMKGALLHRSNKETNPTGANLFIIEVLFKYKRINLLTIVMEHMHSVINANILRCGHPYGFWMNKVFAYFNIECGNVKDDLMKEVLEILAFKENKLVDDILD